MKSLSKHISESLNESNEILKAQDSIKGVMFKISKDFKPVLDKAYKLGLTKKQPKIQVSPYNNGYELRIDVDVNYSEDIIELIQQHKRVNSFFNSSRPTITMQPSTFFTSDIEEDNSNASIGLTFSGFHINESIKVKNNKDIKNATDALYKTFLKEFKEFAKEIDSIMPK